VGKSIEQFPWWTRWWSYLSPVHIEALDSDVNSSLEIRLVNGRLQLCTDNAIYSFEERYENFRLVFEQLDFSKLSGHNVLILGLGLGSIIQLLERKNLDLEYTAVELDEEVIYLAEKYILSQINARVNTVCTSGADFCYSTSEKYDLICMDIFIDDWIPEEFLSEEFNKSLKSTLTENGLIIYNTPAFNKESALKSRQFFENQFQKIFQKGKLMDVHKNYMLLSDTHLLKV